MTKRELQDIVQAHLEAVNAHDLDQLMTFYTDESSLEFPASPRVDGKASIRRAFQSFFDQWDEQSTYRVVVSGADTVAVEGTATGRHRDLHLRIPGRIPQASAKGYRHDFAMFITFKDGKILRQRVYFDARDLVHQLLG